jgi:hypothetical protein
MGDLDCAKSKKGAACLNIMKKGAGPLREVFFEKAKKTGSLETPGISIYLIHCILLRLMYRYPYPFFSAMGRDQTSTSNRIDGTPNSSSNRN